MINNLCITIKENNMAIYGKTGYIKNENKRFQKDQTFSAKWGERAETIAQKEDVAVATIHMRVRNFGSPYQRAGKPHISEVLCGKTIYQLAEELQLHPISIQQRIRNHNNPYQTTKDIIGKMYDCDYKQGRKRCWLMEEHPCYAEWKKEKQIDDAFLKIQARFEK